MDFRSHKSPVENMKWLPKNVWFSQESAFPKVNQDEDNRQFITCAAEMYILVWDFLKPDAGERWFSVGICKYKPAGL